MHVSESPNVSSSGEILSNRDAMQQTGRAEYTHTESFETAGGRTSSGNQIMAGVVVCSPRLDSDQLVPQIYQGNGPQIALREKLPGATGYLPQC